MGGKIEKTKHAGIKMQHIILIVSFSMVLIYLCVFGYLNMFKLVEHADSDTASEVILLEEIWNTKDLSPDNWIASTERRIISPATIGAVFYGMGLSGASAMGLVCIFVGIALIGAFWYMLDTVQVGPMGKTISVLLLLCIAVNGREVADSRLPFFTYLLFLFADYYAFHVIVLLLSIALYIRFSRGEKNIGIYMLSGFCFVMALGLGASGMRLAQVAVLPLIAWTVFDLFMKSDEFTNNKSALKEHRCSILFVAGLSLCDFLGMLYPSSASYYMAMENENTVVNNFFIQVPSAILKCIGIRGNVPLKSFGGMMQLCVYAIFVLMIYCCYKLLTGEKSKKYQEQNSILVYLMFSFLITCFAITVTTAAVFHYYFFIIIFIEAISIGIFIDRIYDRKRVLALLIWLFLIGYGVGNLQYTYVPAITSKDRQDTLREVSDYLMEHDIEYAYSQFWHANRLHLVSYGRIKAGNVYQMNLLVKYWWLTNMNWYPPVVPEDTISAYVVTHEEELEFLEGAQGEESLQRVFENKDYIVYTSNRILLNSADAQ